MLGRVLTAIVTPFREDGAVDLDAFQDLARHLVDNGSDGLVVAGTTGESPTLSDDERRELVEAAVEAVGSDASVVAGPGTYSTEHSMHLTKQAAAAGAGRRGRRPRPRARDRPGAAARLRPAAGADESDRDQGGSTAARAPGGRPSPAARGRDRGGGCAGARLPRAARPPGCRLDSRPQWPMCSASSRSAVSARWGRT